MHARDRTSRNAFVGMEEHAIVGAWVGWVRGWWWCVTGQPRELDSHCPYLLSGEITAKGTGSGESAGK
eukprot:11327651-Prorocentrum_lima.AAC.1